MPRNHSITLLIAEDDADHRMFMEEALENYPIADTVSFVENGQELISYLKQTGAYTVSNAPQPNLILLDLNMPIKDGRQTIKEIKQEASLKHIPVVAFSVSQNKEDIMDMYQAGASGFINKPTSFNGLIGVLKSLENYWKETVVLPSA